MKMENRVKGSYRNIIKCYENASMDSFREGIRWYHDANVLAQTVGKLAGYEEPKRATIVGAGIISALSPQVSWNLNVQWAIQLVTSGIKKTTYNNHSKALRILYGEHPIHILNGRKVRAFYKAIVAPQGTGEPVVDRHAIAIYMGRQVSERELLMVQNDKVMDRIQKAYKKASYELEVHHHKVQAITWSEWRRRKGYS